MSKTITNQQSKPNPSPHLGEDRLCSRCKEQKVSFKKHLSIIATRKELKGSFELPQLHEILEEFTNHDVEVFCTYCYLAAKYKNCDCGKYRYTKEIQSEDSRGNPIYFTLCAECAYELFDINYDEYDYRDNTIKLRRKKHE